MVQKGKMFFDTPQITTKTFPFYHVVIKDNQVRTCVRDPKIRCWQSKCIFKRVCSILKLENKPHEQ